MTVPGTGFWRRRFADAPGRPSVEVEMRQSEPAPDVLFLAAKRTAALCENRNERSDLHDPSSTLHPDGRGPDERGADRCGPPNPPLASTEEAARFTPTTRSGVTSAPTSSSAATCRVSLTRGTGSCHPLAADRVSSNER